MSIPFIVTKRAKVKSKLLFLLDFPTRLKHWNDERYLKLIYRLRIGKRLDLTNPLTYNAKLQWLKLNYRVASHSLLVDKFEVKRWVSDRIGDEYLIPTLGVYESPDQIDFDELPHSFVLKCTHDSGGVVIVRDKSMINAEAIRTKLNRSLGRSYFYGGREPQYMLIRPRVIAEPLVEDADQGQLRDYKFFCFDGEVRAMFVASDRAEGNVKFDYFDAEFSPLQLRQPYPNSDDVPPKPARFDEMLRIARSLSLGHPHLRVDLYEVNGKVYFGELTFFHFSGLQPFIPAIWDRIFGDWLTLPEPVREY